MSSSPYFFNLLIDDFDNFINFYYSLSIYEMGALAQFDNKHQSLSDEEKAILFIDEFPDLADRISNLEVSYEEE